MASRRMIHWSQRRGAHMLRRHSAVLKQGEESAVRDNDSGKAAKPLKSRKA